MISDEIKTAIVEKLSLRFPGYPIRFEHIEGDPNIIGVGIFSVSYSDYEEVNDYILELSFELQENGIMPLELDLIPFVRSIETTVRHYPEIITPATSGYTIANVLQDLDRVQIVLKNSFYDDLLPMEHLVGHIIDTTTFTTEFVSNTETRPQIMSENAFGKAA